MPAFGSCAKHQHEKFNLHATKIPSIKVILLLLKNF
jgi:hypothetical protein